MDRKTDKPDENSMINEKGINERKEKRRRKRKEKITRDKNFAQVKSKRKGEDREKRDC